MARVTVEDCVVKIPNRFELVMKAAQRARDVSAGAALTIERDDDKNPVVALREIADETVSLDELGEALIQGLQKHVEVDEPEEDLIDFSMPGIVMDNVPMTVAGTGPEPPYEEEQEGAGGARYEDEKAPD